MGPEPDHPEHFVDPPLPLPPLDPSSSQPEGEVAVHGEVWPKREVLKHHSDASLLRGHHDPAVPRNLGRTEADHTSFGREKARNEA